MRQLVRGERAALSQLAAIHHRWEVEVSVDAPMYIVDFCCLGLDENGEVFDDDFVIHLNRPDAPRGAIQLNNASNNGAVFALALEELPPRVRRLVFTAAVGENPLPGGLVGAAFSFLGLNADIGAGHLILATPVAELAFFEFSGQDFGNERTLVIGELYLRDEWRFVAAGQPLQGELGTFLRTLTDGPTPAPRPAVQPSAPPLAAPVRPPRPAAPPPIRTAPRPAAPILSPARGSGAPPVSLPTQPPAAAPTPVAPRQNPAPVAVAPLPPSVPIPPPKRVSTPLAPAPLTIAIPSDAPAAPVAVAAAPAVAPAVAPVAPPKVAPIPVAPLNLPQTVPPGGKLQDLIDAAAPGSTLILQRGEYQGPLTIAKPLIFEAQGSAIWLRSGPVVTLASPGVSLHDLDLEITVSQGDAGGAGVALRVEKADVPLQLDAVHLRGRVAGLGASDGNWRVPRALDLGEFAARADNEFRFEVEVPSAATLICDTHGLELSPAQLAPGKHQISLRARDLMPDMLLVGQLEISTPALRFTIPLRGSTREGIAAARGAQIGGD